MERFLVTMKPLKNTWTTFHSLPGMEELWFKIDEEEEQAFKKMFCALQEGNRSPWFRG